MGMVDTFTVNLKYDEEDNTYYVTGNFSDGNEINLGHPELFNWTTATEKEVMEAVRLLDQLWMDKDLGKPGRRNDDAVNLCIALHVLGCLDTLAWIDLMKDKHVIHWLDMAKFYSHILRVEPYTLKWGPEDHMGLALDYTI